MCEVSAQLGHGCKRYASDKKTKLKITKGNNSKSNWARVIILVYDTPSHHTEYVCEVSAQLGYGCKRYAPDKQTKLKITKGNN